ncbi:thioredoxin-like protein [Glomus cerebriforme]|uniref:Thioredoxin-like protein n=1 Tax=Glomus cerebriforme TaxID=658196 RepID=A0A397SMU3_9GLOM|nr:thioredoxin-like protein [Glomus cerebriforme]
MFTNQTLFRSTFACVRKISPVFFHTSVIKRSGQVLDCSKDTFNKLVIEAREPVIVDFYADWCGPCKVLAPILERTVKENKKVTLVKLNTDDNPELTEKYQISALPTVHAFYKGKSMNNFIGVKSLGEIKSFVENAASLANE